jgi:hypothetical protein
MSHFLLKTLAAKMDSRNLGLIVQAEGAKRCCRGHNQNWHALSAAGNILRGENWYQFD